MTGKCADYFKSEKGQGQFGNINVTTKSTVVTTSSLVLRCLELQRNDVRIIMPYNPLFLASDYAIQLKKEINNEKACPI